MAAKTKAKLLEELIVEAEELGFIIPSDILLSHARKDLKAALDALKLKIKLKPSDLPLFTLKTPGAVPAPKDKGLVLYSEGWGKPAFAQQVYAGLGMNFPLSPTLGGTGIANAVGSTLTLGAATSITGGGTLGLGGFTLTVPATGTAALGTGTAAYIARWIDANTLGNSVIRDNGVANVGINVAPSAAYGLSIYNSRAISGFAGVTGIYNHVDYDSVDLTTAITGNSIKVDWTGAGISTSGAIGENISVTASSNAPSSSLHGFYISTTASVDFSSIRAINIFAWGQNTVGKTLTNNYGIYFYSPQTTGTVVNNYGIYMANISGASTLNYAIYTGTGAVRFGDTLTTVGILTIPNNPVIGGFIVTIPITGTTAMGAGTLTSVTTNDVTVAAHTHAITASTALVAPGTVQYQVLTTGANPYPAGWSDFYLKGTTGGTVNFAVTNTKTLTLTATDDYNLTIPATGTAELRKGNTLTVASSGAMYTTISAAIADAVSGDTIYVYPGTYNEGWTLPNGVNICGVDTATCLCTGPNWEGSRGPRWIFKGSNFISKLTFTNLTNGLYEVMRGDGGGSEYITFDSCVIFRTPIFNSEITTYYLFRNISTSGNIKFINCYLEVLQNGAIGAVSRVISNEAYTDTYFINSIASIQMYAGAGTAIAIYQSFNGGAFYTGSVMSATGSAPTKYALFGNVGEAYAYSAFIIGGTYPYWTNWGSYLGGPYFIDNGAAGRGLALHSVGLNEFVADVAATVPLVSRAYSGQTGNLQEWQNSSSVALSHVNADGTFDIGTGLTSAGVNSLLNLTNLGSGANGDGGSILLNGKTSTTAATAMGLDQWLWVDATHASRKARRVFNVYDTAIREAIRFEADGAGPLISIGGVATVAGAGLLVTQARDVIQQKIKANGTQTANILEIETSGGADLITVDPSGNLYLATTQNIQLRDNAVYLNSADDGHMDINADVSVDINAPVITATLGDIGFPYGSFSSSDTQTLSSTTDAFAITYSTKENGTSDVYSTSDTSRIYINLAGTYLITFSTVAHSDVAGKTMDMWLAVNGANVDRTNTITKFLGAASNRLITVTYLQVFTAGQYFELMWHADDTGVSLEATDVKANPTIPACPSIITTVNKISK